MTPDQIALSRKLASLPGFAMSPGMRDNDQTRVLRMVAARTYYADGVSENANPDEPNDGWYEYTHNGAEGDPEAFPDLTDDATGGVLLGWLAEMNLRPTAGRHSDGWWDVGLDFDSTWPTGSTLAEACAHALVAVGRCA